VTERLDLNSIPGLQKLSKDYILNFEKVRGFYARDYRDPRVLIAQDASAGIDLERRGKLVSVLERQNRDFSGDESVTESIEGLGKGARTVVTGQQIGLFCGPMYTLYKAATAVALARRLTEQSGSKYIPIFWMECEDHDILEIGHLRVFDRAHKVVTLTAFETPGRQTTGSYTVDDRVLSTLRELKEMYGDSRNVGSSYELLEESYEPGSSLSRSFARLLAVLFKGMGLVLVDPRDRELKRIGSRFYRKAVSMWQELNLSVLGVSNVLRNEGYEPQIEVKEELPPFFLIKDDSRVRLSWEAGQYVDEDGRVLTQSGLESIAEEEPERLSLNVALRPLLEQYIFSTNTYVAGPGEVSYFAQIAPLYRTTGLSMPAVFPRVQFTIVEPVVRRALDRLNARVVDFSRADENLGNALLEKAGLIPALTITEEAKLRLEDLLRWLDLELVSREPEMKGPLDTCRKKTAYQFERLEEKLKALSGRRHGDIIRYIETARNHLFPSGQPQERVIGACHYLLEFGTGIVDEVMSRIDLSDSSHRLIEM
jgi:bacillithiol biosynthesis cysteine-adding enzyme BshC